MKSLLLLALTICGCGYECVEVGYVGVKVYTMGSPKGDVEKVGVGRYWLWPNENIYIFPTFKQSVSWAREKDVDNSIAFQTKDNAIINADIGIIYHIEESRIVDIFKSYRKGFDEVIDKFLRNQLKHSMNIAASLLKEDEIIGDEKTKFLNTVKQDIQKKASEIGISVDDLYVINSFRISGQIER